MNIVLDYENSALTAPQSFRDAVQTAANMLDAAIYDNITVTILVGYGDWDNGAYLTKPGQALGGSLNDLFVNYSDLRPALAAHETSVVDQSVVNSLPNTSTLGTNYAFHVAPAIAEALGLMSPTASGIDGAVGFDPSIPANLMVGAALHELTHAMGREPSSGAVASGPFDFVRYTSPGNWLLSTGGTAVPAYFSIDGGNTKLADFGQTSDSSDFLNSGVQGPNDPFDEFGNSTTIQSLTAVDKELLDAIGFNTNGTPVALHTDGSTSLVQIGANYFLNSVGSSLLGPAIRYAGSAVASGALGGWTPIGAIQVAGGYDIVWKMAGADQYIAWSTDSNGNYVSNLIGVVSGGSAALEALETTFHQDLNGDGVIGVTTTVIEASGSTSLVEIGNNFYLDSISSGTGPELTFGGSPVVAGQLGGWTPIGAEAISGGYEVAWKMAGADQYIAWSIDSSGNYVSNLIGVVSGGSAALEALETTFHQDLNGDGVIGVPTTVIEASGSTSLVEIGNNFYLDSISSGTGPELTFGGSPVVAGQLGGWTPIGAETISGGYEVAWKMTGADQYTVWSTDSNGNYVSNLIGAVPGSSAALEALETTFHQDLNGDGVIGVPTTVIEASGSTSLVEVGNNFYLDSISSGTGPELTFGGSPVVAGQLGGWTPIGVEAISGGYEVAWKMTGADQYTVWSTDSNGNYVANVIGAVPGSSAALEALETTFQQDLNGDGVIGVPAARASASIQSVSVQPGSATFDGTTLVLDTPATFNGQIIGFTGDGTPAHSDQIDLQGVNYKMMHSDFDASTGSLAVGDGTTTTNLQFLGQYSSDNFHFADDGHGGTLILGAAQNPGQAAAPAASGQDTFVFAANFGHITIANFAPTTDSIEFNHTLFSTIANLLAATHDDTAGNAVITDAAHDTITLQHVTTAQLLANQTAFHLV